VHYSETDPPQALRSHAAALWTLSSDGEHAPADAGNIVPDGAVELVVSLADPVAWHDSATGCDVELERFVVGPLERPTRVRYRGAVLLVAVRLKPSAASSILAHPPRELVGRVVPLGDLLPRLDAQLAAALAAPPAPATATATALLGRAAGEHAAGCAPPDPTIDAAVGLLAASTPVGEVARQLGISARTLERRFLAVAGLSPKRFARIVRLRAAWEAAAAGDEGWASIAADHGYFDQSHLIRDFRELTGSTPAAEGPLPARRVSRPSKRRPAPDA
jgi:AraC-like DNA-binding protein